MVGALELERDGPAGQILGLQPGGDGLGEVPEDRSQGVEVGEILGEGGLVRDRLRPRGRATRAVVLAAGEPPQPVAERAEPRGSAPCGRARAGRRWCEGRRRRAPSAVAGPTPQISAIGFGPRKSRVSARPITAKPRGLSRSEAILARNLLWLSPTETVRPRSRSISAWSRAIRSAGGAPCSRSVPVRSRKASSSDSGSTSGVSASIRSRISAADRDVMRHPRADHHRLRAERERLEHRHRRAHALDPGDVAGGGDHAAPAAADDHRPVAQARVVALLDRGVEGVAVEMRDRRGGQLGDGPACAANGRPGQRPAPCEGGQAVAAKGGGVHAASIAGRRMGWNMTGS